MRVILYTGKGGVGKTSVAAMTGVRLAASGKRVLIMSTDQAHSLGDSLDVPLNNQVTQVRERLFACEIDTVEESEHAWGHMQHYLNALLTARGGAGIEAEELLSFPGLEELFSLVKILDVYEQNAYDVLIVDCAPTGETLSLLTYPEMLESAILAVLPMKKKAAMAVGPAVEMFLKIPIPEGEVFDEISQLTMRLSKLRALLTNKDVLSIRIVTTPEKIVVAEAKRNFACLHLYDYNVDAIVVNKIYPEAALGGYFSRWRQLQEEALREIEQSFAALPIFKVPLLPHEVRTIPVLEETAAELFATTDPSGILFRDKIFTVGKDAEGAFMELYLAFPEKEDLALEESGDGFEIGIRNERRHFTVPDALRGMEIRGAKYDNGTLKIRFA